MVHTRTSYAGVGVAIVMAACFLVGCSAPDPDVAQTTKPGIPEGLVVEPLSESPTATWIERGTTFAVVTWGSSSCPPVATGLAADGSDRITVTFGPSPNDPCTADMAPTTHEFEMPDEVTSASVTIDIAYEDWPETHSLTLE